MELRTYQWTPEGRQRVAWAIQATLAYNEQNRLKPGRIRGLALQAGLPNHTSLGKYHRGVTGHPNNAGGRILRAAAPFIYKIKTFYVKTDSGSDRLASVDFVNPPDPQDRDVAPWEQAECYDFDTLATLGTQAGDELERLAGQSSVCPPEAIWLYNLFQRIKPESLKLVARLAEVAPVTLESLVSQGPPVAPPDCTSFNDLSEMMKDFLVRRTPAKALIWGLDDLARANGINPTLSNLTTDRLRAIIFQGQKATPAELSRLAGCMGYYGVPWDLGELEILNSLQSGVANASLGELSGISPLPMG